MPRHSIFDIMGPIMIGPSSSHTAGAVRLGRMVKTILGRKPTEVLIKLHGSFAETYHGHGTDLALVAGLLGLSESDPEIVNSLALAAREGIKIRFETVDLGQEVHPNTAIFLSTLPGGEVVQVTGHSTGGGSILISQIDQFKVALTGELHSLITQHQDEPGVVAAVTKILAEHRVNIAFLSLSRTARGEIALMTLEADEPIPQAASEAIRRVKGVHRVRIVPALK
ncbi:MAG: L-serine ammonia-lyase, iron-sulfur-dependent, subunit beta [Firmicutes bacterium]|nr:L-serine ammonia-lyase, iron-sulfur-dependent, subunit beta [Bacillota bacterium]